MTIKVCAYEHDGEGRITHYWHPLLREEANMMAKVVNSAAGMASHIPSVPSSLGRRMKQGTSRARPHCRTNT